LVKIVPNLLSILRICLVPVFVFSYFTDPDDIKINAILIYALATFSDFLDGYVARKFQASSDLGKVLDPLGDKLMMIAVMVCITIDGIIPLWAVIIAGIKEALMGIGGFVLYKAVKISVPQSNMMGKVSTVYFFLVCTALMIFRNIPEVAATGLITSAIVLMLVALASYIHTYNKNMKNRTPNREV
jgi:CDP-diacylglycerol--glycerol-3-phosphate 3-phosphatidyltransferase